MKKLWRSLRAPPVSAADSDDVVEAAEVVEVHVVEAALLPSCRRFLPDSVYWAQKIKPMSQALPDLRLECG